LNEWINSRELEKVLCVSSLLGSIPQSFVFTQVDFLSNFLEQADNIGDQCFEFVSRHLLNPIVNRVRGGTIGEPCKEDVILRDQSLAIASQFLIGSPAHKFYSRLAKDADFNIKRQIELGRSEID
jgi:hypothetical protein